MDVNINVLTCLSRKHLGTSRNGIGMTWLDVCFTPKAAYPAGS
jgi:hypothetical protein